MTNDNQNISEIETYLYALMNGEVSDHTFVGTLPSTIKDGWNDMLLIDCDGVNDRDAYGTGVILLFSYARPRSDGSKNVAKLKALDEAITRVVEANKDANGYCLYRRKTYSDYDYTRNWHCNVTTLGITVK